MNVNNVYNSMKFTTLSTEIIRNTSSTMTAEVDSWSTLPSSDHCCGLLCQTLPNFSFTLHNIPV